MNEEQAPSALTKELLETAERLLKERTGDLGSGWHRQVFAQHLIRVAEACNVLFVEGDALGQTWQELVPRCLVAGDFDRWRIYEQGFLDFIERAKPAAEEALKEQLRFPNPWFRNRDK
jgi:hypothetical protein